MAQIKSRREIAEQEKTAKQKNLPNWWKALIYTSFCWTAGGAIAWSSGVFSSKVYGCTVEISTVDSWMSDSFIVSAIIAVFAIFAGFWHLENSR